MLDEDPPDISKPLIPISQIAQSICTLYFK